MAKGLRRECLAVSSIDKLLDQLEGLKQSVPGKWIARCPAHEDRSPSLAIRELPDGRILLYCFGGCETQAILSAMQLQFADLFPEPLALDNSRRTRFGLSNAEILQLISHEITVAGLILANVVDTKTISEPDWTRFCRAAHRIRAVREHGR